MADKIELTPIWRNSHSALECSLAFCKLPSFSSENCLVVSFSGAVDNASSFDGGYPFMHAMIGNGFTACNPAALILDLAELKYEPDDRMCKLIDQKIVTKILVSDQNRQALTSLVSGILFLNPQAELFSSLPEALSACDTAYDEYLRAGRKQIIADDF